LPQPGKTPRELVWALLLCSGLTTALVIGRIAITYQITYYWLVLPNLVLAWIPYGVALLIRRYAACARPRWWGYLGLGALWLAFLPNAPYITTDFIHLTNAYGGVPIQFDIALLALVSLTGLILGFAAMELVHGLVQARWGRVTGLLFASAGWFLSSLGIYIGRVDRWNSWDLLQSPLRIFDSLLSIPGRSEGIALVGAYSLALPCFYLLYLAVAHYYESAKSGEPEA
jgi:uncharacterized membrane protein